MLITNGIQQSKLTDCMTDCVAIRAAGSCTNHDRYVRNYNYIFVSSTRAGDRRKTAKVQVSKMYNIWMMDSKWNEWKGTESIVTSVSRRSSTTLNSEDTTIKLLTSARSPLLVLAWKQQGVPKVVTATLLNEFMALDL